MSLNIIGNIMKAYRGDDKFDFFKIGIIPEGLIYLDISGEKPTFAWKEKPQKRNLYLNNGRCEINFPTMLFKVHNNTLTVYVTDKKNYYNCRFPNYTSSHVCLGNVKIEPFDTIQRGIEIFSHAFWYSTFTESISGFKKKYCKGDRYSAWDKKKPIQLPV